MEMCPVDNLFSDFYLRGKPAETLKNFSSVLAGNDRESYMKAFETIIQTEPPELLEREKDDILATLERFSRDSDLKVRYYVADNLITLCSSCVTQLDHSAGSFGSDLLCTVLSVALRYLSDNGRIQLGALKTVLYLVENGFLDATTIETLICPTILELCRNQHPQTDSIDHLSNALGIIVKIAPIIGQQKTYDMFYDVFIKISKSTAFQILKQCAKALPVMCEVLGTIITEEKLLPVFIRLCEDPSWSVRKVCALVLPQMALLVTLDSRRRQLVPRMKQFMFDESEWVVVTALKNLGQFLAAFAHPQIHGLAYDYRLELGITNAADEKIREMQVAPYGHSNNQAILMNFEAFERELESSLVPMSTVQVEVLRAQEKLVKVEQYLANVSANNMPPPSAGGYDIRRTSSTSLHGAADAEELRYAEFKAQRCKTPVPPYIERGGAAKMGLAGAAADEILDRFVSLCLPLRNNFSDGLGIGDGDDEENAPYSTFKSRRELVNWPPLPPPPPSIEPVDDNTNNNESGGSPSINMSGMEMLKMCAEMLKNDNNDNVFEEQQQRLPSPPPSSILTERPAPGTTTTAVHDDELAEFNSHRYWYIPPPDLDLSNSNELPHTDEDKELTSSCDSTIIMTSDDAELLDLVEHEEAAAKKRKREPYNINPTLLETETEWCLIEDFIHMKDVDNEFLHEFAFYFPAVIFTFGPRFWPLFQPHYNELCYNFQGSVRKTMAASISQIALIIGREHATRDLVEPFKSFLNDNHDEVKMGVIKSISTFIRVIDPSEHGKILNQLDMCLLPQNKKINWRFRETLGQQLLRLVQMHEQINKKYSLIYLIGISFRLMTDRYDCVRKVGMDAFIEAFKMSQHQTEVLKYFRDQFAHDINWKRKQLYVLAVDKMMLTNTITAEMFHTYILEILLNLSINPVPNIRLYAAKCLSTTVLANEYFQQKESLREIIGLRVVELSRDVDRDVRENASLMYVTDDVLEIASLVKKMENMQSSDGEATAQEEDQLADNASSSNDDSTFTMMENSTENPTAAAGAPECDDWLPTETE